MPKQEIADGAGTAERHDCEAGQGLTEYAVLLLLISIVVVAILTSIGATVFGMYSLISATFPVV